MIGSPVLPMLQYGLCGPPSCTVHKREVTTRIGGWRDYRKLNVVPEVDLFRRMQMAGYQTMFVPRLTVIKFPAAERKDVYRVRPCHEQAEWSERIRSEQDFEAEHLAQMLASDELTHGCRPANSCAYWRTRLSGGCGGVLDPDRFQRSSLAGQRRRDRPSKELQGALRRIGSWRCRIAQ